MNRPEVKVVQNQQVETNQNPNIDSWEAEQLLRKYGYKSEETNIQPISNNMTFEEMCRAEELRLENERIKKMEMLQRPKPISFEGGDEYYHNTTYGTDSDTGFSFKIEVTSDMNIPKKY